VLLEDGGEVKRVMDEVTRWNAEERVLNLCYAQVSDGKNAYCKHVP
jgi:hypothetical protein